MTYAVKKNTTFYGVFLNSFLKHFDLKIDVIRYKNLKKYVYIYLLLCRKSSDAYK